MTTTSIPGASVWEQKLYDHLVHHVEDELDVIRSYADLAEQTDSPGFAYLARLILDDERRHHRLLRDLAETIKTSAEMSGDALPIPELGMWGADRDRIRTETERYLAMEKEDNRNLDALAKELRDVSETTLWQLLVRLVQKDNEKHQMILEFVRDRSRDRL